MLKEREIQMLKHFSRTQYVLVILVLLFLFLAYFFASILNYNFLRSDVLIYWQESTSLGAPFNEHPPLYAFVIALARAITFGALPPVLLMMGINLISFCGCILLLFEFFRNSGVSQAYAVFGVLLFGLWPFVGLSYTVVPLADMPAILLTIGGIVMLQKSNFMVASLLFGLGLITHKGVWPMIGLMTVADFYIRRELFTKQNFLFLGIMLTPLAVLWITGALYHGSPNWLIARSLQVNTSSSSEYLVLDGLIGTLREGGARGLVKGLVVLFFMALSIITLVTSLRLKFRYYEYCAAISAAVLIMFLFSSAGTIWGPVRFSKLLVMPLILSLNASFQEVRWKPGATYASIALFLGLFLSQLAYAWYIAVVFFG
jgi:hypothetical protein